MRIGTLKPSCRGAARQEVRIGEQIERRQRQLVAPQPDRKRDVRTDPGRLAERQRERRVIDYRISISAWLRSSLRYFLDSA